MLYIHPAKCLQDGDPPLHSLAGEAFTHPACVYKHHSLPPKPFLDIPLHLSQLTQPTIMKHQLG